MVISGRAPCRQISYSRRDGLGGADQVEPGVLPQGDYCVSFIGIAVIMHLQVQREAHMVALYLGVGQIVEAGEVTPVFGKGGDRG